MGSGAGSRARSPTRARRVAVLGRSESADEAAAELGGIAVRADLTDREELRRGFDEAVERLGGLDILVNSHGIGRASDCGRPRPRRLGRGDRGESHRDLRALPARRPDHGRPGQRQDREHRVGAQLPGRVSRLVVRGEQGRRLAADDGARERVGAARRQRERDRAGLRQDGAERPHLARRPGADGADQRPHPRRPLGRARGHGRRRRLPLLGRLGLRAGRDAAGRRRLALRASGLLDLLLRDRPRGRGDRDRARQRRAARRPRRRSRWRPPTTRAATSSRTTRSARCGSSRAAPSSSRPGRRSVRSACSRR